MVLWKAMNALICVGSTASVYLRGCLRVPIISCMLSGINAKTSAITRYELQVRNQMFAPKQLRKVSDLCILHRHITNVVQYWTVSTCLNDFWYQYVTYSRTSTTIVRVEFNVESGCVRSLWALRTVKSTPNASWHLGTKHVVHQKLTKIQSSSLRSRVDLIIYQRYHASPK
jgi:hypothetical protein